MELIHPYQEAFLRYLNEHPFKGRPEGLYGPANYILSLGGKRLRPVFVLLGCNLFSDSYDEALPAAWAMEVFHNFTLCHDDIMDQADIRRGKATVHQKFGMNTGILSGDLMMIKAYEALLSYDNAVLVSQLLNLFTNMAIEVCEGQQMDMDFEHERKVSIEDYLEMITLKTSVLLAACIKSGALIGGAVSEDQEHLYEFAKNYGIAFQLQDDVLDTFGDEALVGKKIGGDILRNKKTYLYLKALELASDAEAQLLHELYSSTTDEPERKIAVVSGVFQSLNVAEYAAMTIEAYRDLAISHLRACSIADNDKERLTSMLDQLVFRKF
jgi:geranylgeranyl diphosphate synthase, type II